MIGVPEELGGAVDERSAVTAVLMSEALAQGDMGSPSRASRPPASHRARLWGDAEQQATYLPEFVGEQHPRGGARGARAPRAVRPVQARDHRAARRRRLRAQRRQVARARAPPTASCSSSPPRSRVGPGAVHRRVGPAGSASSPSPAMGVRAAATGRLILRGRRAARRRAARRRRPRGLRRVHPARPDRLVRARGRHRPGGARLRDPLRQGAHRVRRADRQPPGGRVRRLQHRDRARGLRLATYRAASRVDQGKSFAREVALARRLAPSTAMRSAPTASSCSAATATSRSTRSSAGTATCARPA
jgi:hypothetical protein